MANRSVRFPAKTALFIIFMAAAVIVLLIVTDLDYKIFFPVALALFGISILAFGMKSYARRKFKLFIWGMKALKFRKYEDSIKYFGQFLEYYDNNPQIERWKKMALGIRLTSLEAMTYFYKGVASFQNKQYEPALECFETAAEIAPDFQEAQYDCAVVSAKMGKNKQALIWLSKVNNPPKFLIDRAKTADEFKNIRDDKIFKKFIAEKN